MMIRSAGFFFAAVFMAFGAFVFGQSDPLGTPAGEALCWNFTEGVPSGGTLRCAGALDGGLVPTTFDIDKAGGFQLADTKFALSEAFRFEATLLFGGNLPEAEPKIVNEGILWDSMYVVYKKEPIEQFNRGFQLTLKKLGENRWQPWLYLGYGEFTDLVYGPTIDVTPSEPVRLAFYYDANGAVQWDFGGQRQECATARTGALTPSCFAPTVGDRIGSNFDPFPGRILDVAIQPCRRAPHSLSVVGRAAFRRGEEGAVSVKLFQATVEPFEKLRLTAVLRDGETVLQTTERDASALLENNATLAVPVETRLVCGDYPLDLTLTATKGDGSEIVVSKSVNVGIGPLFSDRMTALMWGYSGPVERLREFGFTHGLDYALGLDRPDLNDDRRRQTAKRLDEALCDGIRLASNVLALSPSESADEFYRKKRDGEVMLSNNKPMLEVSNPAVFELTRKTAAENAPLFADHPALGGILANTERRDGVAPSFGFEPELYRAETGREIPLEAEKASPARSIGKERFPDGVVPDDDELLALYSWFWGGGDGWPRINTVIADAYRKVMPKNFFSFFDPAVRVPPKWGSGGNVDVLSQWVYAVPEPLSVAGPVEELFAMAAGNNQRVMIMTQIICYRNQVAPKDKEITPAPSWVTEKPNADFPAIPPDSLQEATWAMIAKPVEGIMYHGWQCIVETGAIKGYTFTNSETPKRLTYLLKNVVAPLGPVLKNLPREDSPVIVLESFANAMFSGYATWGWKAPDLLFLQRARLDPRVVYDETILREGLGNAKVLYMPQCAFLTKAVLEKIVEFQKNGGLIIADEKLLPALKADIDLDVLDRENAEERNRFDNIEETSADRSDCVVSKEKMNVQAEALREKLAPLYRPRADSSDPELVTFSRRWNDVDYLFVINDRRTFGDYVGQWRMTMERGLAHEGFVTMADENQRIGAVYELSRGGAVPFTRTESGVRVDLKYETNDGRLLAFLEKPIASLALDLPETVASGEKIAVTLHVLDAEGEPIHALLPVEIRVFDSEGNELDGAGYLRAENGVCTIEILTNFNDALGPYRVTARDRASGLMIEKTVSAK